MRMVGTLLVLAVLLGVAAIGVQWLTPRIERDVHDRVTASLAEKGLLFANVHVQGREVTLLGDAPTEAARDQAISSAANVFGVARVKDGLSVKGVKSVSASQVAQALPMPVNVSTAAPMVKPKGPYTLSIVKSDDKVILRGMVDSEDSRTVLRRIAATHYGEDHVTDELQVVAGAPEGWRSAAGAALFNIVNLENANVTLSNTEVMVSGDALDSTYNTQAEDGIRKALPTAYKVAFALDVVSTTAPVAAEVEPAAGSTDDTATCANIEDVRVHKVMFGFDKAEIAKVYEPTIKSVANTLNGCDQANLEVAGHTDITGSKLYNKWLSEQRAEAGVRALMRAGVAKERLTAKGYGEAKPVGDNKTRSGRAANRRIEFVPSGAASTGSSFGGISLFGSDDAVSATEASSPTVGGSWWDRISTAINRAEAAVSATNAVSATIK